MNTREINGSAWQLKYYFITAIPLAVLTVFLPLIILPAFSFVSRHLPTRNMLSGYIHWTLVILTFVLNIYTDILYFLSNDTLLVQSGLLISLLLIILLTMLGISYVARIHSEYNEFRRSQSGHFPWACFVLLIRKEKWGLLLVLLAVGCFIESSFKYPFVELLPYIIYFIYVWFKNRKQKKSAVEDMWFDELRHVAWCLYDFRHRNIKQYTDQTKMQMRSDFACARIWDCLQILFFLHLTRSR